MIDNRGPRRCFPAIRGRKKIACNDFHFLLGIELSERFSESAKLAGGPDKTTDVSKAVVKQRSDYFRSDKATGSSDQDALIPRYNVVGIRCRIRRTALSHFSCRGFPGLQAFHLSGFLWPFLLFFLLAFSLPRAASSYPHHLANLLWRCVSSAWVAGDL